MSDSQFDNSNSSPNDACNLFVQLNITLEESAADACANDIFEQWTQGWQWYAITVYILCAIYTAYSLVTGHFRVFSKCGARQSAMILNMIALLMRGVWALDAQEFSVLPSFLSGWVRFALLRLGYTIMTASILMLAMSWGGVTARVHLVTVERKVRHRVGLAGSRAVLTRSNKRRRAQGLAFLAFTVVTLVTIIFVSILLDGIWLEDEYTVRREGSLVDYFFGYQLRQPITMLGDITLATFWVLMFGANLVGTRRLHQAMNQFKDVDIEDRPMVEDVMKRMWLFATDSVLLLILVCVITIGNAWLGYDTLFFRLVVLFSVTTLEGMYLCSVTYGCVVSDYSANQPVEFVVLVDGKLPATGRAGNSENNEDPGVLSEWVRSLKWQSVGCGGIHKWLGCFWCGCRRRSEADIRFGADVEKQMEITQNPLR